MHMKRLTAPKTWHVRRKEGKFIIRPRPSGHPMSHSISLIVLIRDVLHLVNDTKEAKRVITTGQVMVDGVSRRGHKFAVGFMDVIEISETKSVFRVSLDGKGRLKPVEIPASEKDNKICRIKVKKHVKGGVMQFGLHDGRSIMTKSKSDNKYKVNDSLLIHLPDQKIIKHLPVEKDVSAIITSGKHAGELGSVEDVQDGGDVTIKADDGSVFDNPLKYVFVLGKKKPEVKVR